jgi:hypothetical protein
MTTATMNPTATRMRGYTVDVQDGTGDRFTLTYWAASVSAIPDAVRRESAQFLAHNPTCVAQSQLKILAIRHR